MPETWTDYEKTKLESDRLNFTDSCINHLYGASQKGVSYQLHWHDPVEIAIHNSAHQKAFGARWNDIWASKC